MRKEDFINNYKKEQIKVKTDTKTKKPKSKTKGKVIIGILTIPGILMFVSSLFIKLELIAYDMEMLETISEIAPTVESGMNSDIELVQTLVQLGKVQSMLFWGGLAFIIIVVLLGTVIMGSKKEEQ